MLDKTSGSLLKPGRDLMSLQALSPIVSVFLERWRWRNCRKLSRHSQDERIDQLSINVRQRRSTPFPPSALLSRDLVHLFGVQLSQQNCRRGKAWLFTLFSNAFSRAS